ncbi:hypothetical protein LINPERPRIM_LOCUS3620 [Linum perenne]
MRHGLSPSPRDGEASGARTQSRSFTTSSNRTTAAISRNSPKQLSRSSLETAI